MYICINASKRLYALRILKRSGAPPKDLTTVYCAFIRPVLEYTCQVWHFSLPQYLADEIESVQRRALRIVLPNLLYAEALDSTNLHTFKQRRQVQWQKPYRNILVQRNNKLGNLLPEPKQHKYSLRSARNFDKFKCRTACFQKCFIPCCVNKWDSMGL